MHGSHTRPLALDPLGLVARARAAGTAWAARRLDERLRFVRRFRHLLVDRLAALEAAAGRPGEAGRAETLSAEVMPLLEALRWLEREAAGVLAPRRVGRRGRPLWLAGLVAEVRRAPLGVVLVVAPGNYPLFLPGVQAAQALVAGNAVLLKPAPGGETAARLLADLMGEAGLDADVVQVLPASVAAARAAAAAGVDHVVLTGSADTGRAVLTDLAPRLVPATMELSGCDAVHVLEGADLDHVARALRFGLLLNGGRTCIAPRRVLAAPALLQDLEARLARELAGAPERPAAGEVVRQVQGLVADARARGARLAHGRVPEGDALGPIVLADVPPEAEAARADVFAPLLSLVPVDGEEGALAADAACPYALGASVFGPPRAARARADRLQAGVVVVNDLILPTADPRLPFGGRGESGFGTTRGPEGLLALTVPKTIVVRRGGPGRHLDRPVGGEADLFRALLVASHAGRRLGRLGGWRALLGAGRKLARRQREAQRKET